MVWCLGRQVKERRHAPCLMLNRMRTENWPVDLPTWRDKVLSSVWSPHTCLELAEEKMVSEEVEVAVVDESWDHLCC